MFARVEVMLRFCEFPPVNSKCAAVNEGCFYDLRNVGSV